MAPRQDIEKICDYLTEKFDLYCEKQNRGSHWVLSGPDLEREEMRLYLKMRQYTLTIPSKHGKEIKRVYYQKLLMLLDVLEGGKR